MTAKEFKRESFPELQQLEADGFVIMAWLSSDSFTANALNAEAIAADMAQIYDRVRIIRNSDGQKVLLAKSSGLHPIFELTALSKRLGEV